MPPYQNLSWLLLPVLLITLFGCDANDKVKYATPQLQLQFAPRAPQQTFNVIRIEIVIEGPGFDPIPEEFSVEPGQGRLDVSLIVPLDATLIRVEAYEIDANGEERIAFKGESPITDLDAATPEITVALAPTTGSIGLTASATDLAIGDEFTIEVSVADVDNLFAITFEVLFDDQRLEVTNDISAGSLFGPNPIIFDDSELPREANRLGIAIAQRGGTTGVSGAGIVATIGFRAKDTGTATIRVAQQTESDVFSAQQPGGEDVDGFNRLAQFLTRATVDVTIR